ncbi:protein AHNAK2-like isoform X7 [Eriocheir sinensis]|uniref:protein AHNAK2-like isoform X7 n=1 Tax=Eriocheir sinensis TaxID=95602 RepID=UPI0021C9AF6C|nr:protein AHNAK2-like isoform X7 [Eriocheir sinensis]
MKAAITISLVFFSVAVRAAGEAEASGTNKSLTDVVAPAEGSLLEGWQLLEGYQQAYGDLPEDVSGAKDEDHSLAPEALETTGQKSSVDTCVLGAALTQPGLKDTHVPGEGLRQTGLQSQDEITQGLKPEEERRAALHQRTAQPEVAVPSTDSEAPATEGEVPLTEDEVPSTEDEAPLTKDEVPSTEDEVPSTEGEGPATEDEVPSTEDEVPSTEDEVPSTEDEVPSTEDEVPSTEDEVPSTEGEGPATEDEVPSTEDEVPSTELEVPSTEVEVPSTEGEVPSTEDEGPAMDGKGLAADGEGLEADGENDIAEASHLKPARKVVGAVAAAVLPGARMLSESPVTARWKVWLLFTGSLIIAAWRVHIWRLRRRPRQDKAS